MELNLKVAKPNAISNQYQ